MIRRVCVAGSGVIGSLFAGHLAQVCEVSVLARREEHAQALNADGLRVTGRSELHGRITAATEPAELPEPDLVLVCCKGTDVEAIGGALEGHFPGATVMTTQNGLGADEIVGRHGEWPLLTSVTFMSGTRDSDTSVEYILDTATWIGPSRETTGDDARAVAELIRSAGLKAEGFDDLRPMQWSKLIFNATVNAVAALTGLPHEPRFAALDDPGDLGHLVLGLMDEGKAVAAAAGVELAEDPWEMNIHATRRGSRHSPSMLEDVEAHRRTEIDLITGALILEGERYGVETPLHTTLYRLVKAKEASWS
ncbi:MAG TPA: 2-dehydropantoate 2-reductase [Gaiellaceae bacterium]|nr:2-dehydropantoate 2-reductase [Gaiellaceae bacterium]